MSLKRHLSLVLVVLLAGGPIAPGAEIEKREVRVAVPIANVRAEPSIQSRVLQQVRRGDVLRVVEESGDWYLIAAPGMPPGYVSKTVVEPATPEPIAKPEPASTPAPVAPAAPRASTTPQITHDPLKCVLPEVNPLVLADVTASAQVQKSRVYFKAHQFPDWYYIDMKAPNRPHYLALLPQPLPETERVDYYVHALDTTLQTTRTDQYEPAVSKGGCRRDERAPKVEVDPKEANQIVIGGTREGQPPIPPGFSKVGILAFVTVAGALVTGAALQASVAAASATTGATASATTSSTTSVAPSAVTTTSAAAAGGGMSGAAVAGIVVGGVAVLGGAGYGVYSLATKNDDESDGGSADVTSRNVTVSIIDHNAVLDDYYDLYINGSYIGPVRNPAGGTTRYSATLRKGSNTILLSLTQVNCCNTALTITVDPGGWQRQFEGTQDHSWTITAP